MLGEKKASKMIKKYSDNYEIERAEEISRANKNLANNLETSNKHIYNRRPMSPLKNSYKPMVFSLTSRTYQNYHSRKYPWSILINHQNINFIDKSPSFSPLISNYMDCSDSWVDNNIKNILRMIPFFETFAIIHWFYLVEYAFHEYLVCLWSFSDWNQWFVKLFCPFQVGADHVLVLVEWTSNYQQLEDLQKQLFSLNFIKNWVGLRFFQKKAFSEFIADFDFLVILGHHFWYVALFDDIYIMTPRYLPSPTGRRLRV